MRHLAAGTGLLYIGTSLQLSYALGRNRFLPPVLSNVSSRGIPLFSFLLALIVGEIAFLPSPAGSPWSG
ncbi:MAG: hypothetical protein M3Z50_14555 [Actinomycetota bacterium]|nr:hypothetical protein [Actinomycetota bacterium]